MSPILTRPVREQLEHDRVIRQLQARYKRKLDVIINPGNEQNQSVMIGDLAVFPDLLLYIEGSRRLVGTVEVETGESVNAIEARAEWGNFAKLKVPLHLYVPPICVDAVRRICDEYQILVSELWTYSTSFDQVRFTMVYRSPDAPVIKIPEKKTPEKAPAPKAVAKPAAKPAAKPVAKPAAKPVAKAPAKAAKPAKPTKPAAKAKPAAKKPAPKPKVAAKPVAKAKKPAPKAKPAAKKGAKKK